MLIVVGVVAAALQPSSNSVVRVEDGNIFPAASNVGGIAGGGQLIWCVDNRPGFGGGDRLGSGDSDLVVAVN